MASFGLENLGANYSFYDGLSSAFGALCFGLLLPSAIYKQHATYEDDRDDSPGSDGAHHEETCTVPACFQAAYSVVALVNGLAVLCAVALTRSAYRRGERPGRHRGGAAGDGGGGREPGG